MNFFVEDGIRPLVEALNRLPFARTVYSCEGHFDRTPDEKYLPTAYVTFGTTDVACFQPLYRRLLEVADSCAPESIRLVYDCFLGRHTLSVWAGPDARDPLEKHKRVNSLVARLAELVLELHDASACDSSDNTNEGGYPCRRLSPPCSLIIPQASSVCPFTQPPAHVGRPVFDES